MASPVFLRFFKMNNKIIIKVLGLPVAKGRPKFSKPKNSKFVMVYTPKKTKDYEGLVKEEANKKMQGIKALDCPLKVSVVVAVPLLKSWSKKRAQEALSGFIRPTKKPDLDNFIKAALDACNGIVWRDDSIITRLSATKIYSEKPALTIIVEPILGTRLAP
jgi:Holliday junction resolvase RusA-like endonuclease